MERRSSSAAHPRTAPSHPMPRPPSGQFQPKDSKPGLTNPVPEGARAPEHQSTRAPGCQCEGPRSTGNRVRRPAVPPAPLPAALIKSRPSGARRAASITRTAGGRQIDLCGTWRGIPTSEPRAPPASGRPGQHHPDRLRPTACGTAGFPAPSVEGTVNAASPGAPAWKAPKRRGRRRWKRGAGGPGDRDGGVWGRRGHRAGSD